MTPQFDVLISRPRTGRRGISDETLIDTGSTLPSGSVLLFDIVDIEEGIRGWRWFILLFGFVYPGTRKLMFSQRWVLAGVYLL
ncbi:MAG: hypothetical protein RIM33_11805, partial [Alphaproteobacteria bacterium]